jgi:hypothetical protein
VTIRSRREIVTFKHPFRIAGVDWVLSAGAYEVITDVGMIEGLSFVSPCCYRDYGAGGSVTRFNDGDDFHQIDSSRRRAAH